MTMALKRVRAYKAGEILPSLAARTVPNVTETKVIVKDQARVMLARFFRIITP